MEAFAGVLHGDGLRSAGVLRIGALAGETTASLIARVAAGYGLESRALLSVWRWLNHRPRHDSGALRADAAGCAGAAGAGRHVRGGPAGAGAGAAVVGDRKSVV